MKGLKGVWLGIDYIDMGMGQWDCGLEMEEWEEKKTTLTEGRIQSILYSRRHAAISHLFS